MTTIPEPTRAELKEKELRLLFEAYKKDQKLFERPILVEDAKMLSEFGIYIPGKESFPYGVIKFVPQDFIVEEVSETGEVCTIQKENVLSTDTTVLEGPTIYATIVKCGLSTLNIVTELTKALSCSVEQIRYAGLKDKDAITSQRFSFRQISIDALKNIRSPNFFIKDVTSGKGALEKGRLKGNQFTIFIRVEKAFYETEQSRVFVEQLAKVKNEGFYNYFYLQRFGTPRLAAHYWGLDMIHGYNRKVVENFISFASPREIPYFKNLRRELGKRFGNWNTMLELLELFPLIFTTELRMVHFLQEHSDDFAGAIAHAGDQPAMWVTAASSWLFNLKLASYVKQGIEPPPFLPLFLDPSNSSNHIYDDLMKTYSVSVQDFRNLDHLPSLQTPKKPIKTREQIAIEKADILDSGIALKFFLPKGEYATTFLAHLFNLIADRPPIQVDEKIIDVKEALGESSAAETLDYFLPSVHPKSKNYFEELAREEDKKIS